MSLIDRKELKYATGSIAGESPPPDAIEPDVLMFLNLLHAVTQMTVQLLTNELT